MAKLPSNGATATPPMPGTVAPLPTVQPAPIEAGAWPADMQDVIEGELKPSVPASAGISSMANVMNSALQQQTKPNGGPVASNPAAGMAFLKGTNFAEVSEGGRLLKLFDRSGADIYYEGKITESFWKTSEKGNECINLKIEITFPLADAGVEILDNLAMTEKAAGRVKSLLRACELLSEDGQTPMLGDIAELIGEVVRFKVVHNTFTNPKTQKTYTNNRVDYSFEAAYETPGLSNAPQPTF